MNDKYQKISTVVLVLIMLNGLVWFGTIFTWFGSIYSLLALPFVFLPLATLMRRKDDRYSKIATVFEVLAFIGLLVFTVIMFMPF